MKKNLLVKIVSLMMAVAMLLGVNTPAYAAEGSRASYLNLGYGEAKNLIVSATIHNSSYVCIGIIKLPNDARVHRIIYKASFVKSSADTGIGDVNLNVQFRRNNSVIYSKSFTYGNCGGETGQQEVTGVSMGQEIEVWVDASSANPSQSNGNLRNIFLNYFQVYTD